MNNTLQRIPAEIESHRQHYTIADMQMMAEQVAKSGLYKMDSAQAFTLMALCQAKGMNPMEAMERYHIFNGRPSMRADAMLAEFQRHGGRVDWVKDTDKECEAVFYHPLYCKDGKLVTFTFEDARRANLAGKDVWKAHPRNMLRARVITNGVRLIDPGVILGIYTPDEIEEFTPAKPVELQARTNLAAKLAERKAPVREIHQRHEPVAETVATVKAATEAEEAPKSDCRQWIEDTLEAFNAELLKADPTAKRVTAYQVGNTILTHAIAQGWTEAAELENNHGKRDPRLAAKEINRLWEVEQLGVMKIVGEYLSSKLPVMAGVGNLAVTDEDLADIAAEQEV